MGMNEKSKKRFVAIARQLKEQKGVLLKQAELTEGIKTLKEAQVKIDKTQKANPDSAAVQQDSEEKKKKLQDIIDELNDYMKILHPEGLLNMGKGSSGKSVMGQG